MRQLRFVELLAIGIILTLAILTPQHILADNLTIVVMERSSDAKDKTNHESNKKGLPEGATAIEASNLDDAAKKIQTKLGADDCVKNLHFRGHGSPGNQSVGDGVKHRVGERIDGGHAEWKEKLKKIRFCDGATIHLWGCNVGSCDKGATKLKMIADALGVTVRGAVNTVNAGDQENYTGPIQVAKANEPKPDHKAATTEKAKKKKPQIKYEDTGGDNKPKTYDYGEGNGFLDTEDVGCDGIPGTFDQGESDGLLNVPGFGPSDCPYGPGEDTGCDNIPNTGDFGEGDGSLNTEDIDGDGFDTTCDCDRDGDVDFDDIKTIFSARNTPATVDDPRDADGDGVITVNDARICVLQYTDP